MGLVVRLYDIVSPNDFDLKIGLSPYGPFTQLNGTNSNNSWPASTERNYRTDPIYIGDNIYEFEFDTQYWIRIEDKTNVIGLCDGNNNHRFITENIYIHDSKTFECYDKINFSLSYQCNP
jgi:hypothetical protein